jgi:hypothetical protein
VLLSVGKVKRRWLNNDAINDNPIGESSSAARSWAESGSRTIHCPARSSIVHLGKNNILSSNRRICILAWRTTGMEIEEAAPNANLQFRVSNGLESAFSPRRSTQNEDNFNGKAEVIKLKRLCRSKDNPAHSTLIPIIWRLSYMFWSGYLCE